jgi:hypothetical protein
MLSQLFAAAKLEGVAPLPYVRSLLRLGNLNRQNAATLNGNRCPLFYSLRLQGRADEK